ncbi:MAG: hypothetical protein PVG56_12165 [Anaerolineae bacterium]
MTQRTATGRPASNHIRAHQHTSRHHRAASPAALLLVSLLLLLSLSLAGRPAQAQQQGQVQHLSGRIDPGQVLLYRLPDLQAGQTLYVRMEGTSGNLDPNVALIAPSVDPETLEAAAESAYDLAFAGGADPLEALDEIRDRYTLAWDDDGGGGLAAALEYEIPAPGEYRLLAAGALTFLGGASFGDYDLWVGLDAPGVLSGEAEPTGDTVALLDFDATPPGAGIQVITGSLTLERPSTFAELHPFGPGDTLYATVEATAGDLRPILVLRNYASKPLRTGNLDGRDTATSLQYTFPDRASNYQLELSSCCEDGALTSGDYRLVVGVNAPEVLAGQAEPEGRQVIRQPVDVQIGIKLEQIIDVDQANESFTAQASMQMDWTDPALAYNPDDCQCDVKTYTGDSFNQFVEEAQGRWPAFTLQNQQGNRWTQNKVAVVWPDGRARYLERFTTDFQVDFDFRPFPFDTQEFIIRVDALFPEEYYAFSDLPGYSEISSAHGEDEFRITGFETTVTSEQASASAPASRFTFRFTAPRHLNYYLLQVFIPILLIVGVSWITFFLRDYGRRIEVASANLLLFIAFSFSLSDNYPRLGYLTFLDYIMAAMFILSALVVAYNVWLKRMEMRGEGDRADRIDRIGDWVYPLANVVLLGIGIWAFLIREGGPFVVY